MLRIQDADFSPRAGHFDARLPLKCLKAPFSMTKEAYLFKLLSL